MRGVDQILALMPIAMQADLVAPTHDLVRDVGVGIELTTQHEERRPCAGQVEGIQYGRGRVGVGTVIEGQDRVASRGDTFDAGVSAPARSAAGVPLLQSLPR